MSNLPSTATSDAILKNLAVARITTGSGGGGGDGRRFMRVCHKTGAITHGKEDLPVPDHRYAVKFAEMLHGYTEWRGGTVTSKVLKPMALSPLPMPASPYVGFGEDGPRKTIELNLYSVDEPGFVLIEHCNPIIEQNSDSYVSRATGQRTYTWAYKIVDWASDTGVLQSQARIAGNGGGNGAEAAPAPWDNQDD